jgi:hypothetical protein
VIVLFSAFVHEDVMRAAERIGVCEVLEKDRLHDLPAILESCVSSR